MKWFKPKTYDSGIEIEFKKKWKNANFLSLNICILSEFKCFYRSDLNLDDICAKLLNYLGNSPDYFKYKDSTKPCLNSV